MNAASRTGAALAAAVLWVAGVVGTYGDNTAWYMNTASNFTYRQEIVISGSMTDGNLTNFPVLVVITNQSNPVFGKAQSNGNDIMFMAADGQTKLSHELEVYTDSGSKQLVAWVNIPLLPSGRDTEIQMCYGNGALTNQQDRTGVWTNNFLGVWHLNEAVSAGGTNYDSSPSGANAMRAGSGAGGAPGKIGGGNAYNGSNDYADAGDGVLASSNGFTLSAWVYCSEIDRYGYIECNGGHYIRIYPGNDLLFTAVGAHGGQAPQSSTQTLSASNWYYVVMVARPDARFVYFNGVDVSAGSSWGDTGLSDQVRCKYFGGIPDASAECFHGKLDEMELSGVARSANWIVACYRNQNNPSAYVSFGPETGRGQWEYRQKIVIGAAMTPNTDQTNFPALIAITNQDNGLFGSARANGDDILFTASNGTTRLAHEIESYTNAGAKQLVAWVKIPTLSHTNDTTIYMYYGNSTVSKQADSTNVWEDGFLGVWHLSEATGNGGVRSDSTANGHNAVRMDASGRGGAGASGKIAACDSFAGYDDHYDRCVGGVDNNTNGWTLSAWVYTENSNAFQMFEASDNNGGAYAAVNGGYGLISEITDLGQTFANSPGFTQATWHHVVFVCLPSFTTWGYLDGQQVSSSAIYSYLMTANRCAFIGRWYSTGYAFQGRVDELEMSGVTRSADWIKASYRNQDNPNAYISLFAPQARPIPGLVFRFR